jgi:hypothetical protein
MKHFICLLIIFTLLNPRLLAQSSKSPHDAIEELDTFIGQAMEEWHVPGLAVSIIRDGRVLFAKGYGIRDLKSKDHVTTKTLFSIARQPNPLRPQPRPCWLKGKKSIGTRLCERISLAFGWLIPRLPKR